MARVREGRRGRARREKGKGKTGNINMMGRRQVMTRWADDSVRIQDEHW